MRIRLVVVQGDTTVDDYYDSICTERERCLRLGLPDPYGGLTETGRRQVMLAEALRRWLTNYRR